MFAKAAYKGWELGSEAQEKHETLISGSNLYRWGHSLGLGFRLCNLRLRLFRILGRRRKKKINLTKYFKPNWSELDLFDRRLKQPNLSYSYFVDIYIQNLILYRFISDLSEFYRKNYNNNTYTGKQEKVSTNLCQCQAWNRTSIQYEQNKSNYVWAHDIESNYIFS